MTSVVSSVATAYFQLRELDMALDIARHTLVSRQESLRLTRILEEHGSASLLDLRQAQELVETAAEQIPDLERQIQQQEDLLRNLLGENPGPIPRGLKLTEEPLPPPFPPDCLRNFWSGVRIFARPKRISWRPTQILALLGPISFPISPSPQRVALRVSRSIVSCRQRPRACGTLACPQLGRFFKPVLSALVSG